MLTISNFLQKKNNIDDTYYISLTKSPIFTDVDWYEHNMITDLNLDYQVIFHRYNLPLFNSISKLEDIKQGKIGNCFLLTALALLTRKPHIIDELFLSKTNGLYGIKIYYQGIRKIIIIDNLIPSFKTQSGIRPLFAQNKNNVYWVMLLEKALAKIMGSYGNITSGNVSDILNFLTDSYHFNLTINTVDKNQLWELLMFYYYQNPSYIYTFGIHNTNKKYLIDNHSYGIIDLTVKNNLYFLKLHNPWGFHIDESTIVKENGLINNQFTGEFWIHFDEYYQVFKYICVNQIPSNTMNTINISEFLQNDISIGYLLELETQIEKKPNKLYINYSTYSSCNISLQLYNQDLTNLIIDSKTDNIIGSISVMSDYQSYIIKPQITNNVREIQYWITIFSNIPIKLSKIIL